jgi:putative iron-dependent peroxidase
MSSPQPGIFALGTRSHHHLEVDLDPGADLAAVRVALKALTDVHVTSGAANLVIGFGPDTWRRLAPDGLAEAAGTPFTEVVGRDGHVAPATQHDVWAWVHGAGADTVLDTAVAVAGAFADLGTLVVDQPCFTYHDSRDLTGFVDGTANPSPVEAPAVALVPHGAPGAGGSHVLAQRWYHDLEAFHAQPVADQERVFGRTKLDSVALPRDERPPDSHSRIVEIHDADGEELEIYRRSTPMGAIEGRGIYFLAFSADQDRFRRMLAQMYGTDGHDGQDRLLAFSTARSGAFYFAPALADLVALGMGD